MKENRLNYVSNLMGEPHIAVETLQVRNMLKNSKLAKSISNVS